MDLYTAVTNLFSVLALRFGFVFCVVCRLRVVIGAGRELLAGCFEQWNFCSLPPLSLSATVRVLHFCFSTGVLAVDVTPEQGPCSGASTSTELSGSLQLSVVLSEDSFYYSIDISSGSPLYQTVWPDGSLGFNLLGVPLSYNVVFPCRGSFVKFVILCLLYLRGGVPRLLKGVRQRKQRLSRRARVYFSL